MMSDWQRFGLTLMLLGIFIVGVGALPGAHVDAALYLSTVLFAVGSLIFLGVKEDKHD